MVGKELTASRDLYRTLIEALPVSIVHVDQHRVIQLVNESFSTLCRRSKEELIGLPLERLLVCKMPRQPDKDGRAWEQTWQSPDGRLAVLKIRSVELRDTGELLIIEDITVRREAETRQAKLDEAMHQAERLATVGRLAGGIAHDFNNLLLVISGYCELLRDSLARDSPLQDMVAQIAQASERATQLTRQLLAFSRRQPIQPKVVDVNDVIRRVEPLLIRLCGEDIRLRLALASEPAWIRIDPAQLDQVLLNLAANARDAMPRGGELRITVRLIDHPPRVPTGLTHGAPRVVRLEVADTGCGMSDEVLARCFEPFFTTKEQGKGTGLGLATVHGIVTQAGGLITVASKPGHGTTFTIEFPCVEARGTRDEAAPIEEGVLHGGRSTILVVEDEPQVRRLLVEVLRGIGYRVLEADSGPAALELLTQHRDELDLVVTDVVMPGINGVDLVDQLKAQVPSLRVLFVSGYPGDKLADSGWSPEAGPLVSKPFTRAKLAQAVQEVLRMASDQRVQPG
jgi:PAS domain S-box-containing protein